MKRMTRSGRVLGSALVFGMLAVGPAAAPSIDPSGPAAAGQTDEGELCRIIFRSGETVTGRIIEETDQKVVFRGKVNGIEVTVPFEKSDILKIERGVAPEPGKSDVAAPEDKAPAVEPAKSGDQPTVYVLTLEGQFGVDIAYKPIEQALEDAKQMEPDYLVVIVDNDWSEALQGGLKEKELGDDLSKFDEFFTTERIAPLFAENIRREWKKQPEVVFWVKQAMGGIAFLPFTSPHMYFESDARLGGVGYLDRLFGSMGDEMFRQKQRSLRQGMVRGIAIEGGYDTEIIDALTWTDTVLSYKLEGGKPVFFEREPENAGEVLLTDDGKDDRQDTIEELARGEGNDVLTLRAELARTLGVSDGTVDTLDDLLFDLGISRGYTLLDGRADRIMSQWHKSIKSAVRQLPRLWKDYQEIQITGADARERNRQRSRQIAKLEEIKRLIQRHDGALVPQRYGYPGIDQIDIMISQIRLDITADRD